MFKRIISKSYVYFSFGAILYSNYTLLQTLSKIDQIKIITKDTNDYIKSKK